jgi:hypothetical protein
MLKKVGPVPTLTHNHPLFFFQDLSVGARSLRACQICMSLQKYGVSGLPGSERPMDSAIVARFGNDGLIG